MTGRYELSDQRWQIIENIVSPPRTMGRPRRDDRQMLNGILWIPCSGAQWKDLPGRYGPCKTVYKRFRQWRADQLLTRLHLRLREDGTMDFDTWFEKNIGKAQRDSLMRLMGIFRTTLQIKAQRLYPENAPLSGSFLPSIPPLASPPPAS